MAYYTPKFEATGEWRTEWWSFRHTDRRREISFCHSAALINPEGEIVCKETCCYCNRTWECHPGDSVRSCLADKLEGKFGSLVTAIPKVAELVSALKVSRDIEPYRSDAGTRVGYSLSMFAPM